MKVLVLRSSEGDWEGLFIGGELIDEGHRLGDPDTQIYLLKKSEEYGFTSSDVEFKWIENSKDEGYLYSMGCFPKKLEELDGDY